MAEAVTGLDHLEGGYGRHEVMDRVHVLSETFSAHVLDHPWMLLSAGSTDAERGAIDQLAVEIGEKLGALYQALGQDETA